MKNLLYIVLAVSVLACDKINLQVADSDLPVVESYLIPGKMIEVTITRQMVYDSNDTEETPLSDLDVEIFDETKWYTLENGGDGLYTSSTLSISEGKTYTLRFNYNGKQVSASTLVPTKPIGISITATSIQAFSMDNLTPGEKPSFPDPDTLSWENPEDDYYMLITEKVNGNNVAINSFNENSERLFRSEPVTSESIDVNSREFNYYGVHYLILCHINGEYAALYEQLSTTSIDIQSPPSNIENGLGIFTALNTDTVVVEVVR